MQHTYLRYECADAFGITASSASSKAPQSNSILAVCNNGRQQGHNMPQPIVLTTAGSVCMGFHLRTTIPTIKIGHREQLSGGVGTGKALNSDQLVCIDVIQPEQGERNQNSGGITKVATGWVDGAVRIFDVYPDEFNNQSGGGYGLIQTLLHEYSSNEHEDFIMREPLVLNGHSSSPIRTVSFCQKTKTRLASGSSDGSVVLWDIIAETGLFRLLGHRGGITDIQFANLRQSSGSTGVDDYLITSSLDGLVKVWDLNGQCCTQTIPNHKGEVWGIACQTVPSLSTSQKSIKATGNNDDDDSQEEERVRMLTGSNDGQVRVWSVHRPKRSQAQKVSDEEDGNQDGDSQDVSVGVDNTQSTQDDIDTVCSYMGPLVRPPNVATSSERISCIHFHPNGRYVGILHANSRNVDIYVIRSVQESMRKKQRRLRRRKEKSKLSSKQATEASKASGKGNKRGLLDDPESEEEHPNSAPESTLEQSLDPEMIKASDEFEYYATARASHKVKGFVFVNVKEKGSGIRVVCALSTNALETHSLIRKKER